MTDEVWISCHSHRARAKLRAVCGDIPSFGIWPPKGWPRGEYFRATPEQAERLRDVKGLRVMANAPRGGRLFERGMFG